MPVERRGAYLARLESSRVAVLRDLFLLLKTMAVIGYTRDPGVQAAIGVEARCDGTPSPLRLDPEEMRVPGGVERCDVVVGGSGAGGASVARVLSEAGMSVIVLQAGAHPGPAGSST